MASTTFIVRPSTPPASAVPELVAGKHVRHISESSTWSSPDSIDIQISTPLDRSPDIGPHLLPKIRTQDHFQDGPIPGHRRAVSQSYQPVDQTTGVSPQRGCLVPVSCDPLITPSSATSTLFNPFSAGVHSSNSSPISLVPPFSHRKALGHTRSVSASGIDDATLGRYGFPTYRQPPVYVVSPSVHAPPPPMYPDPRAFNSAFPPPPLPPCTVLPTEQRFSSADAPADTLLAYLCAPNPAVDLVRQAPKLSGRGMHQHWWWDVRQVRPWADFTLDAVMAVPDFPKLLDVSVPRGALPVPALAPARLRPDTGAQLADVAADFYAFKLNAALKVALGPARRLALRRGEATQPRGDGPTFVAGYVDAADRPLETCARLVGLVRPYHRWNSGQRHEPGQGRVCYLEGLACLQRHMRAANCRYGFLMNETELVCARLGTGDEPFFGYMELAAPIETRHREGLTAGLALCYLHMLARNKPLPGQSPGAINVAGPTVRSRMKVLEKRDDWIPMPQTGEKRDAKRMRGWVWPTDPFSKKKEGGKALQR